MFFTKLIAWQKNHELVLVILKVCETIPKQDVIRNKITRDINKISKVEFQKLAIPALDSIKLLHNLICSLERQRNTIS
jgi:hypothetical protein